MKGLKGKNVLVTGATSGIGQAIAAHFVAAGANVALNYRDKLSKLDGTKDLISEACRSNPGSCGKILPVEADVSEETEIVRMFAETIDKFGSLDILINNAGIQNYCPPPMS